MPDRRCTWQDKAGTRCGAPAVAEHLGRPLCASHERQYLGPQIARHLRDGIPPPIESTGSSLEPIGEPEPETPREAAELWNTRAGESALLEACESVDRLVEIIHAKSRLAAMRSGGSFGIAVDESPLGCEWQTLDSEERAIRLSIRAAIRAAKGER